MRRVLCCYRALVLYKGHIVQCILVNVMVHHHRIFFQIAPMIRELMIGEAGHLQIAQNSGSYSSGTRGENQVADLNGYLCNSFFHTQLVQMPPLFWEETFLCHGVGPNALKYLRPKKIIHCHVLLNSPST